MMDEEQLTYLIGDSDLVLLGLATVIAARYQFRRKSGKTRGDEGFPQIDHHALELLVKGMEMGRSIPLDDVSEIFMSISGRKAEVSKLLDMAYPERAEDDEEDDDDDEPPWNDSDQGEDPAK